VIHLRPIYLLGKNYDLFVLIGTMLIGLVGALLAQWIGAPLPWLLGSVVAVGVAALVGVRIASARCFLIEAIAMGEQHGADIRLLNLLQLLRLIICVLVVPTAFMLIEGGAVGSASGIEIQGPGALGTIDAVILFAAGIWGVLFGRWVGLPAAIITGPILLSGAAHLAGLTDAAPPGWMVAMTQLVVGFDPRHSFCGAEQGRNRSWSHAHRNQGHHRSDLRGGSRHDPEQHYR